MYSWFASDVTAVMLVYRTMVKEVFWGFDSIIMQNLSDILPLFCTPTCPPHHVSATQEYALHVTVACKPILGKTVSQIGTANDPGPQTIPKLARK